MVTSTSVAVRLGGDRLLKALNWLEYEVGVTGEGPVTFRSTYVAVRMEADSLRVGPGHGREYLRGGPTG